MRPSVDTPPRNPPQPTLIVRLSHLGDVACTLPVFHALRELYPRAEIAWACQPECAGLLEGLAGLQQVLPFDRRGGARAWIRLRSALRAFAPELCVDAQGNWKSAVVARLSGAARRVAWDPRDWREPLAARLATEHAPPTARAIPHLVDRVDTLVRHLGWEGAPRRDPDTRPEERARARAALDSLFPAAVRAPVLIQLSPPADPRSWPAEHVASLATALEAHGLPCLLLSGPGEEDLGRRLFERLGDSDLRHHRIGQASVRELAALCSVVAERGGCFVGADSGPLHVAWTSGLRVVCLAGPQSYLRTGPWPPPGRADSRHRVVLAADPPACAPCRRRSCDHPRGPVCMADIGPERVLDAVIAQTLDSDGFVMSSPG